MVQSVKFHRRQCRPFLSIGIKELGFVYGQRIPRNILRTWFLCLMLDLSAGMLPRGSVALGPTATAEDEDLSIWEE